MKHPLSFAFITVSALALMTSLSVMAQQTTTSPTTAGKPATTAGKPATESPTLDKMTMPVWPQIVVPTLPPVSEAPAPVNFALPQQIEGVKPDLLAGVTASGYARKVDVDPKTTFGQVLVQSVSKGDKTAVIDASGGGFTAQFDAKTQTDLKPEKSLEVTGSRAALISALEKLNGTVKEKSEEKKTSKETDYGSTSGGSGSKNSQAYGWQVPTENYTKEKKVVSTRTSMDGCSVRIDLPAGEVIQQVKTVTTTNGVDSEGACADGDQKHPIERDYLACGDLVDMTALKAYAQYKNFYIDGNGANQTFGLCETDRDKVYPITEKDGTCLVLPVVSEAKAYRQSVLVYTNDKGEETEVRGCDKSTKHEPISMRQDTAACSLRHNFKADETGFTDELGQWVYDFDGVTHAASACLSTGRTFPHSKVYQDTASQNVCQPIVDQKQQLVTLQYRKAITVDGQQQFISECTPDSDPSLRLPVKGTTDGCTNPNGWTHDVAAVVSYGQRRFYFDNPISGLQYITDCIAADDLTYPHQHVRTGWENHDEPTASTGGYALPITRVSIDIAGTPYTVLSGEVLPGAVSVSYVKQSDLTAGTGKYSYSGCDKYETTLLTKQFKRPDNTLLQVPGGAGANRPMGNACTTTGGTKVTDWTFVRGTGWGTTVALHNAIVFPYNRAEGRTACEYQTSQTLVRDDGVTFSGTTTKRTIVTGFDSYSVAMPGCESCLSSAAIASYVSASYTGITKAPITGSSYEDRTCDTNPSASVVSLFRSHLGW